MSDEERDEPNIDALEGFFFRAEEMGAVWHKVLLFGDSGSGKTFGAIRAAVDADKTLGVDPFEGDPGVAIFCFEGQARQSIKLGNPRALVHMVDEHPEPPVEQLRDFISLASSGAMKAAGVHTIVLDGLTEIQRCFKDEILGDEAEDVEAKFTWDDWDDMAARMRRLLRTLRGLDLHVICTALAEEKTDNEGAVRKVWPAFQGNRTPNEVSEFFAAVGYCMKSEGRPIPGGKGAREIVYSTMWEAVNTFKVKSCFPLRGSTPLCGGQIISVLSGDEDPIVLGIRLSGAVGPSLLSSSNSDDDSDDDSDEKPKPKGSRRRSRAKKD